MTEILGTGPRFDGTPRKLGVELEFVGVALPQVAELLAGHTGGTSSRTGKYRYQIESPKGTFEVELDVQLMHKLSAHYGKETHGDEDYFLEETVEALIGPIVTRVSPSEIITPPLSEDEVAEFDGLIPLLRQAGAEGTGASLLNAFGLHVNIDLPSLSAETVLGYLQSYLLLQDWLVQAMQMDTTRRISSFARNFPKAYALHVLQPGYRPSIEQLIDDYLAYNPTRNRALDLLPLFAYLDEPRVTAVVQDALIKKRPVLHWRMPNCRIDEAGWSILGEIKTWATVERLAGNDVLRGEMAAAYLANASRFMHHFDREWESQTERWLATA